MAFTVSFVLSPMTLVNKNQIGVLRALREDNDSLFLTAKESASLRFIESHQPKPLFVDKYAGCWVTPDLEIKQNSHPYCVATKFIDDQLIQKVNDMKKKQVVLLTDGLDARPYRLCWPKFTVIFDVSPNSVHQRRVQDLRGMGAKISEDNIFYHVPLESPHIPLALCNKGFEVDQPSVWAMQGLPIKTLVDLKNVLLIVSKLAKERSFFLGELPSGLAEIEIKSKSSTSTIKWMEIFFLANGFRVEMIVLEEFARSLGKELILEPYKNIPFVAQQQLLSDFEIDNWGKEHKGLRTKKMKDLNNFFYRKQ